MAENGWPDAVRLVLENPEFGKWVEKDGDMFFEGWRDLVSLSVKLDGGVVVDSAGGT